VVTLFTVVLVATALERVVELVVSVRHARWALDHGGVESGRGHYPWMVALHVGLLVGALVEVQVRDPSPPAALVAVALTVVVLAQGLRWWCIATLGRQWNTRVIVVPGMPLVTGGPYRFVRHPNYVAVVAEGVALPLVGGAWVTAVLFTLANAVLLTVRIRCEDRALDAVRSTTSPTSPTAAA
jgi:methyltransferase